MTFSGGAKAINGGCKPFSRAFKPFPVVYCYGKSETYLGDVLVFPTTNLQRTLPVLSDKIGVAEHQLSVFIAEKNSGRRIPFTGCLTIASAMSHGGAYYFYVKRCIKNSPLKNKNLSERSLTHQPSDGAVDRMERNCFLRSFTAKPWILEEYENLIRMEILRMNREASLKSVGYVDSRKMAVGNGGGCLVVECKECIMADMSRTVADFHLCAHDEVTVGFTTSAGPISRPVSNAGEDGN